MAKLPIFTGDPSRLCVQRIIDLRARGLFGDNLQYVIEMPTEARWRMARPDADEEDDDAPAVSPDVSALFMDIVADVEAWVVVEKARRK